MRQLFIVRESYVFGDIAIAPVLLFCFHYACTCIVIEWSWDDVDIAWITLLLMFKSHQNNCSHLNLKHTNTFFYHLC